MRMKETGDDEKSSEGLSAFKYRVDHASKGWP